MSGCYACARIKCRMLLRVSQSLRSSVLRSLRHRNFRLFTLGQSISLIGTWMQQVAVGWLVYRMTGSPLLLGVMSFAASGPTFFLAPMAGAVADRAHRHRLLVIVQSLMMVQSFVLAALVLSGKVEIWHLILLSGCLGCLSAFDIPIRQSFLVEMVEGRADLSNAIALNSSMFNAARLVGPAIAGFAIGAFGEGWTILINAVSYVAVLIALLAMRVTKRVLPENYEPMLRRIREGFHYVFNFMTVRAVLALVAVVSLLGVPFTVFLPVIAADVLHGNAKTLGLLTSATGLGALSAALFLASRRSVRGLGRLIVASATLFGGAIVGLALSRTLLLSLIVLALAGFGMMLQMASSNTFLQTVVDDDKRGRVLSLYTMAYIGVSPIGSLLAGWVAQRIGVPWTLALGGSVCVLAASWFAMQMPRFRAEVRPIYHRMGIIPEVATGIQAATQTTTSEETGSTRTSPAPGS